MVAESQWNSWRMPEAVGQGKARALRAACAVVASWLPRCRWAMIVRNMRAGEWTLKFAGNVS
eukprot:5954879-Pyramimonas_sp.AAC.1